MLPCGLDFADRSIVALHTICVCNVRKATIHLSAIYVAVAIECTCFVLRKKGSKTKKRMKEEEIEKGNCGPPTRKVFFEILLDLNQAVPNHLADDSQTSPMKSQKK